MFKCVKCGVIYNKGELTKIAKMSKYGVRQEYCVTKQCITDGCDSRLFITGGYLDDKK